MPLIGLALPLQFPAAVHVDSFDEGIEQAVD
jgi:hypothetical protein